MRKLKNFDKIQFRFNHSLNLAGVVARSAAAAGPAVAPLH